MDTEIRRRRELGVTALEYLGVLLLAAAVLGAIFAVVNSSSVGDTIRPAFCSITLGDNCGPGSGSGDPSGQKPDYGGMGSTGEDPGDDTQLPEGLSADDPIVKEMMETERGRRILQWLHDNNIKVTVDPGANGAWYSNGEIVLGPGYQDASTLVHEANHAQYDAEGRNADVNGSKTDFVDGAIKEEANGVWLEVVTAKERREAGANVPVDLAEQRYDTAYQKAYDRAIANGSTPAQAHGVADDAGRDAIENMFYDGTYQTSTNGQSYPDYYGDWWKSVNCPGKEGC